MRVSIVLCNYNYAAYLEQAIRSALEQSYGDVEVIVVDDGSTDHSPEIIERWRDRVQPVRKANGGQISAYNAGFERVSGDVVVFLDSDDALDPNACETIAAAFSDGQDVKLHYRLRLIDAAGNELGGTIPRQLSEGDVGSWLRERGQMYQSAPGSGNAYRVSALRRLMPIEADPSERHGADFFLIFGVSLLGRVKSLGSRALGSYRVHAAVSQSELMFGNASRNVQEPFRTFRRYAALQCWVVKRLGPDFAIPPPIPEFSIEKQAFAMAVFQASGYFEGLRKGAIHLSDRLLPAIRCRPGRWFGRVMLTGWAAAVLVLPRRVGLPVARYVCNPASRPSPVSRPLASTKRASRAVRRSSAKTSRSGW